MASILDLYGKTGPKTAQINKNGKDKTPLSVDGGKDLAKDTSLEKVRHGKLNTNKYSDTFKKK
jgi:hypothetical protein